MATFRLHCSPGLSEPPDAGLRRRLEELAARVLSRHPAGGAVDAVLTDDDDVRRLNREFRGKDQPTDVLSFDLTAAAAAAGDLPPVAVAVPAGELYLSVERAAAQAVELDATLEQELSRLLVHGLLHLAGYDHQTEAELVSMERETEALLEGFASTDQPNDSDESLA